MLALALMAPAFAWADDAPIVPLPLPKDDPKLKTPEQQEAPTAFAAANPEPKPGWGYGKGKSWFIPAFDIIVFDYMVNRYDHYVVDDEVYGDPVSNFRQNMHRKWVVDTDPFAVNQFFHPYQGSMYQQFARSAGLNFWQSAIYTFAGSALWETAGEHTQPSINDMVSTGIGGNFLGEPLFRLGSLLLESGPDRHPGFWRGLGAAIISPSTMANRIFYGDKFDGVFPSHDPAVFTRVDLGMIISAHESSNVNRNTDTTTPGVTVPQEYKKYVASLDATVAYGLPGKPGYTYSRPFDYFAFQFTAATTNTIENIISRGLLVGDDYAWGDNYRGIWGMYGTFDYIAPQIFRVSTTGVGIGTTMQWWMTRRIALQGTVLGGTGYGAGGVIRGAGVGPSNELGEGQRDYHYGFTPQGLISGRMILGDRLAIDANVREYYVSRLGASESTGDEDILRAELSLTLRVWNLHGLTVRYTETRRDANYTGFPETNQRVGAVSIVYSLLGQTHFGAVDWRAPSDGGPPK